MDELLASFYHIATGQHPTWVCSRCSSLVEDREVHNKFHDALRRTAASASMNDLIG